MPASPAPLSAGLPAGPPPDAETGLRVLIVKMSSMGDVIHALPVVNDVRAVHPLARIDWIVDEGFADLVGLQPAVTDVLPVPLRRWRAHWREPRTWLAMRRLRRRYARQRYDLVLDLQGLVKSAWVAGWVRGERVGYSRACAREPLASLAYRRRYDVDMAAHAVEKMRSLAGQALGYTPLASPFFGLAPPPVPEGVETGFPYRVFLTATSRAEKRWPTRHWEGLLRDARREGRTVLLPWGSEDEKASASELVKSAGHGTVLPRLTLLQCAGLLAHAEAVVGVDTGLTHLAAAFERPTVALFAATEASRYGPYWSRKALSLGTPGQWPDASEVAGQLAALLARIE